MVFCAYIERETMAATVAPNVTILDKVLEGLRDAGADLRHQAGFNGCADTHDALIAALKRLKQQKIIP